MTLSPMQLGQATRLQKRGLLLREIAAKLDVTFEDVCLALFGANDWGKRDGRVDEADAGRRSDGGDGRAAAGAGQSTPHPAFGHLLPQGEKAEPDQLAPRAKVSASPRPAPRPSAEPVVEPQPQGDAADAAPVVVDAGAAPPVLAARPRAAAAALAATGQDSERWYRLVDFDGRSLHGNRRGTTLDKQYFWQGTGEAVARLKRSMPQWQDLEPVEIGGGE